MLFNHLHEKYMFIFLGLLLIINSTNLEGFSAVTAKSEFHLAENQILSQLNIPPGPPALLEPTYPSYVPYYSPTPDFLMIGFEEDNNRLRFKLEILQDNVVILTFNQVQDNTGWDKTDYSSGEIATFTLPDSYALPDGDYEWRAFVFDGRQWSEGSRNESFTVEAVPGKVEMVAQVPGTMKDVFVQGDYAYAISDQELIILDVSNPAQPIEYSYVPIIAPTHVVVSGSYAYVTGQGFALKVIDVSDPFNPVEKGVTDSPYGGNDLYVSGSYAYIVAVDFGLRVIDISNPETPREIGYYPMEYYLADIPELSDFPEPPDIPEPPEPPEPFEPTAIVDVHVSGSYAYVIDWPNYFRIIDISNPVLPVLVSTYSLSIWGDVSCVHISGSYAYIGTLETGVHVIDVSNPLEPIEVGLCDPHYDYEPFWILDCGDIYVSQSYAYLAHDLGMMVLDISAPTTPQIVGWYGTWNRIGGSEPQAVYTSGSYVYLADYWAGLLILHFKEPQPPQNMPPDPPALFTPRDMAKVSETPTFIIHSMDTENDILQYKIKILQNNMMVRAFDQTHDTTGWDSGQYFSDQVATFTTPENQALQPGTYQWHAYAHDGTQWSPVSETRSFTITEGTLSISGRVSCFLGEPIEGALVEAIEGCNKWSTKTDVNGIYIIDGLVAGNYDIRVSAVNRPILTQFVELKQDENFVSEETVLWPESGEFIQKYAPVLYFSFCEEFRPTPVELFLDHATINNVIARHSVAQDPNMGEQMNLEGSLPREYRQLFYKHMYAYSCYGYNPDRPITYARIYIDNQYYVIQYWFHYLNNPIPHGLPYHLFGDHEGDWEMIQLIWTLPWVDEPPEPAYAVYSRHVSKEMRVWSDVNKIETHPCVYVGCGTHASYFDNGDNNSGRHYNTVYGIPYLQDYTGINGPFYTTAILFPHTDNRVITSVLTPELTSENWTLFPGRWGIDIHDLVWDSFGSPIGPAHKGEQWADPIKWSGIDLP